MQDRQFCGAGTFWPEPVQRSGSTLVKQTKFSMIFSSLLEPESEPEPVTKTTLSRSQMGWLRNTVDRTDAKQVGWIDARHDGCLTGWMDRGKTGRMLNRLDGWMQDSKEASH